MAMALTSRTILAVSAFFASSLLSSAQNTSDVLIGFTSAAENLYTSIDCVANFTRTTYADQWAECVHTTANPTEYLAIGCNSGTLSYIGGGEAVCTSVLTGSPVCGTYLISRDASDTRPVSQFDCVPTPGGVLDTLTLTLPTGAEYLDENGSRVTVGAATPSDPSSIPPSTASESGGPTSSPPNGNGNTGSRAWIAGAVIGPIIGLALIIGAIFFVLRRRRLNGKGAVAELAGQRTGAHGKYLTEMDTNSKPVEIDDNRFVSELEGSNPLVEMPNSKPRPQELKGTRF